MKDLKTWARRGIMATGATAIAMLSLAVPGAVAAGLKTGSATVTIPVAASYTVGTATATCPGKSRIVSGGFVGPSHPNGAAVSADMEFYNSFRASKTSWTASAVNNGTTIAGPVTSFAYCLKGIRVKAKAATVSVPAKGIGAAVARCSEGTKPISGGFRTAPFDPNGAGAEIFAFSSARSGKRSWKVQGGNYGNVPGSLTAVAYCVEGPAPKARTFSTPMGDGSTTAVSTASTASCKRHEVLVSGGFATPGWDITSTVGPQAYFFQSFKSGRRTWSVGAGNFGQPAPLTAIAYCFET
jgi:hypothetical protein